MKREYLKHKRYILVKYKKKLEIIDTDWTVTFNTWTGENDKYYVRKSGQVMCKSSHRYLDDWNEIAFETNTYYIGKFIATSNKKEDLEKMINKE